MDLFKPTVKWGGPIFSWDRIPEVVRLAFREMWAGRPGPVHLEVPGPILYETGDAAAATLYRPDQYRVGELPVSENQVLEAAEMLAAAKRPLVVSGSGVDRAKANAELLRIVECLNSPVMTTMAGRSTVPSDHPNHIYGFGGGGDAVKQEADVVLVAGSRLGNLDLPYDKYWGDADKQTVIQIDIDPRHVGVTRPVTLGIIADLKPALHGLAKALKDKNAPPKDGQDLAHYRQSAQTWWDQQFALVNDWTGQGIHPAHSIQAVGKVFGNEAIYTTDGGQTTLWTHWFLPPTSPCSYNGILELGMLGTGIPSAIGAKLANPGREVVCVKTDRDANLAAPQDFLMRFFEVYQGRMD